MLVIYPCLYIEKECIMKFYQTVCSIFIFLFGVSALYAQDTLQEIALWELPPDETFNCVNLNGDGSDLNNDDYDDFILLTNHVEWKYLFYMGAQAPSLQPDFELDVPFGAGYPSWGGDLNNDGYKDIVFGVSTYDFDPGAVYICYGGEEIDCEPELILHGEDYVSDPAGLLLTGFNGGYDFNGDGYDDLLTWGVGPDILWNGLIQIFLGGEEMSSTPDFQIQGNPCDELGLHRAVGDINGDGFDDLIVSRDETMNGSVFLEVYLGGVSIDTTPDYISDETYLSQTGSHIEFANGDINCDGFEDYILPEIGVFLGNESGILSQFFPLTNCLLSFIDMNCDTYSDILYNTYDPFNTLNIIYGSSNLGNQPDIVLNTNGLFCLIGDYNGDGRDEIIANTECPSSNTAILYKYNEDNQIGYNEYSGSDVSISNYPNPFNPATTIYYELPVNAANPVIEIFTIKGKKIKKIPCQNQTSTLWDGTDEYQNIVSSGVYIYQLKTSNGVQLTSKMIMMK